MGIPFYILFSLVVLAGSADGFDVMYEREDNPLSHVDTGHELSADALNVRVDFSPYDETWATFKTAYDRQYQTNVEEALRFQIFVSNLKMIEVHNAQFIQGNTTFWMGINQFADMTTEEYRALNGLRPMDNRTMSMGTLKCSSFMSPLNYAAPGTVDWRKKGYVTPVKNQKQCGSCWAFSTTGSLEGQHFRKTKHLVSLSEQQLVDCAGSFGPQGCNGGDEPAAYAYIYSAHGIDSEKVYPYKGRDQKCRFVKSGVAATLSGCKMVKSGSEKDLQTAVSSQGPISVNIDASQDSFKAYAGGVYVSNSCRKGPSDLDHAVLAVGYGTVGGKDYWIVKNSWGATWGLQGYIQMARNKNNMCGIATSANFPIV